MGKAYLCIQVIQVNMEDKIAIWDSCKRTQMCKHIQQQVLQSVSQVSKHQSTEMSFRWSVCRAAKNTLRFYIYSGNGKKNSNAYLKWSSTKDEQCVQLNQFCNKLNPISRISVQGCKQVTLCRGNCNKGTVQLHTRLTWANWGTQTERVK